MLYKTIIHELLMELELPTNLAMLTVSANLLKRIHLAWSQRLHTAKPAASRDQIASEAMELALQEFQDLLRGLPGSLAEELS